MAGPRIIRQGKRLQICHETPRRLYNTQIYPITSSNGSNILISGTDAGLHITWSGGRPLYFTSKSEGPVVNGANHDDSADVEISEEPESDDEALFESDDDEVDDEKPYPSDVQDVELRFGSPVLHIAVPHLPAQSARSADVPELFAQSIVLVAASSDGTVRLVTLPLDPPSAATKRKRRLGARVCTLEDTARKGIPRCLALTWTSINGNDEQQPRGRQTRSQSASHAEDTAASSHHALLVAVGTSDFSGKLCLYRVPILTNEDKSFFRTECLPIQSHYLSGFSTSISFNTSSSSSERHALLLIADVKGYLRVYDPFASKSASTRITQDNNSSQHGACVATLTASYRLPRDTAPTQPSLAHRKKILDAQWLRDGHSIIALLEDGEWSIWDLDGASSQTSNKQLSPPSEFVIRGFIGDAPESSSAAVDSRSKSQLVPMTPNTRRVRQENLFSGPSVAQPGLAARGGISVSSTVTAHGSVEESMTLWYNTAVYSIPSLTNLWQRSTSNNGRDTGSLHGSSLSRIDDLDLQGETINSVVQLPPRQPRQLASGLGSFNAQRDLLVTAEHRTIILASARQHAPARPLFAREPESPTRRQDQVMLDRGDLDVGGMGRMLDSMTGIERTGALVRGKRVGFAAH